jgi:hypothetical protein
MTNEEFRHKVDFIVAQQAQFAVDIERLRERQEQTVESLAQTDKFVAESAQVVTRLANVTLVGFTEINAKINALVDSQIRTEDALRKLIDRDRSGGNGPSAQ